VKPLISICIPTYNRAHYLRDAIESALAQTYPHLEVIVSDNASTDETMDLLATYADDPRVKVFRNEENVGIHRNFWRAIQRSNGTYLSMLCSDDVLLPDFIDDAYAYLERHRESVDVVYGSVLYTDKDLKPRSMGSCAGHVPCAYAGGRNEFRELLRMTHMRWQTTLFPRELFDRFGRFDESLHAQNDWEYYLRLAAGDIRFGYLPKAYALIRQHTEQMSSEGGFVGTMRELDDYLDILERYLHDEHRWRFHGIERTLLAHIERWSEHLKQQYPQAFTLDLRLRIAAYIARLRASIEAPPPLQPHERPRVSVILPTTGQRLHALQRALASLARQTYRDFEIIVVQNGSESLEPWLKTFQLGVSLRCVTVAPGIAPGTARNIGLKLAAGELITYLDDDNCYQPEHLSNLVALIDASGSNTVFSAARLRIAAPTTDQLQSSAVYDDILATPAGQMRLLVANAIPLNAVLHRITEIERCGGFPEGIGILEDWLFLLSLTRQARLPRHPAPTVDIIAEPSLMGSQLVALGPPHYLGTLDAIYRATQIEDPRILSLRSEHRARVESLLGRWDELRQSPEGVARLLSGFAGAELPERFGAKRPLDSSPRSATR